MNQSALIAVGLLCAASCWSEHAQACALVSVAPSHSTIESAFVFWNEHTKVQHLLLSIQVDVDGPFSFWLPLPSKATARVTSRDESTKIANALSSMILAYRARARNWELPLLADGTDRNAIVFGGNDTVEVFVHSVDSKDRAIEFLGHHDRGNDLALLDYLERYAHGTSHVVEVRGMGVHSVFTSPYIHMQFEASSPWYPYREPAYAQLLEKEDPAARLLRITIIDTKQIAVQHGSSAPTTGYTWLAFEPTHDEVRRAFGSFVDAFEFSGRLWLTSFEDGHATRPGNDDWTFVWAGGVPERGKPGTVGDVTGAGIVFDSFDARPWRADPVGAPLGNTSVVVEVISDEPDQRRVGRVHGGRKARGLWVFGSMVCIASVVAVLCGWESGRRRGGLRIRIA